MNKSRKQFPRWKSRSHLGRWRGMYAMLPRLIVSQHVKKQNQNKNQSEFFKEQYVWESAAVGCSTVHKEIVFFEGRSARVLGERSPEERLPHRAAHEDHWLLTGGPLRIVHRSCFPTLAMWLLFFAHPFSAKGDCGMVEGMYMYAILTVGT